MASRRCAPVHASCSMRRFHPDPAARSCICDERLPGSAAGSGTNVLRWLRMAPRGGRCRQRYLTRYQCSFTRVVGIGRSADATNGTDVPARGTLRSPRWWRHRRGTDCGGCQGDRRVGSRPTRRGCARVRFAAPGRGGQGCRTGGAPGRVGAELQRDRRGAREVERGVCRAALRQRDPREGEAGMPNGRRTREGWCRIAARSERCPRGRRGSPAKGV